MTQYVSFTQLSSYDWQNIDDETSPLCLRQNPSTISIKELIVVNIVHLVYTGYNI